MIHCSGLGWVIHRQENSANDDEMEGLLPITELGVCELLCELLFETDNKESHKGHGTIGCIDCSFHTIPMSESLSLSLSLVMLMLRLRRNCWRKWGCCG